ncbi:hypothetical protein TSAR_005361 [Trichomalopsis sarcophagae]|uniref:Uncharacterized protein n=1 Tax=Trichomalopsis sarcophagae TaxID=543379 RepID=A0A232FCR1_9HYME|nr:hypothetical protein TSAR_005361 [Trichomalopsis sarcophagae]
MEAPIVVNNLPNNFKLGGETETELDDATTTSLNCGLRGWYKIKILDSGKKTFETPGIVRAADKDVARLALSLAKGKNAAIDPLRYEWLVRQVVFFYV